MADDDKASAKPAGFVPLKALTQGAPGPTDALAEIRRIYFATSKKTIGNDFAHAIALLKSLPDEDERARAHVYMEGLAEMQREWERSAMKGPKASKPGDRRLAKRIKGGGRG